MNGLNEWGALAFGLVVGWITYRTLRRTETKGISDIAAVIAAIGGGLITKLFPEGGSSFGAYGVGLAIGFFVYLVSSLLLARATGTLAAVNEWLGEPSGTSTGSVHGAPPPLPARP